MGGAPGWGRLLDTDLAGIDLSIDHVRGVFGERTIERATAALPPAPLRSAVAVVVSEVPTGGAELLLTRRAWHLRTHRGEVAFPGGIEEPGDRYPAGTALREAAEEVGLDSGNVEVVGALDPLTTFAGSSAILPVVAVTPRRPAVTPSPSEVDSVLHVPLVDLLHPECYRQELWSWPGDGDIPARQGHPMHFFEIPGDTIWGATAAMLHQFLTLIVRHGR